MRCNFFPASEEIGIGNLQVNSENVPTTASSGREENTSSEIRQEEESVIFEEVPPATNVEKIGPTFIYLIEITIFGVNINFAIFLPVLPPDTCDKSYGCSDDVSRPALKIILILRYFDELLNPSICVL